LLDLLAPGAIINSTNLSGGYTEMLGTSMAAPHVAGAAALLFQVNNSLTPDDIEKILNETGVSIYDDATGLNFSRIDVYNAIKKVVNFPKINKIQCHNSTDWTDCSNILYGSNLTQVRANCTDINGHIINATFKLENVDDNHTFFDNNATSNETDWWIYDNEDITINDSGEFRLTVTCYDNKSLTGTDYESWIVPWGKLNPYLINPTGNKNVAQNKFFNFTSGVECINGECGNLSASLYYFAKNFSIRTCSDVWGFNCGDGPPERGDNTFDNCNPGAGNSKSVEEIYINATSVAPRDVINVTCEFDAYDNFIDYDYIWYFNGSGWKNVYGNTFQGNGIYNVSVTIVVDNIIGTHWVRCGITYAVDDNECIDVYSGYNDNDDINFTVKMGMIIPLNSGTPFYTTSPNPQNNSHDITKPAYCLANMKASQTCNQTWQINATATGEGELNTIWQLFTLYSPINYLDVEENLTEGVNIIILPLPTDTSKFYIKNSSENNVAWLGDEGNIVLAGECYNLTDIDATNLTAPDDSFVIKNASNDDVAYIDGYGDLYISKGSCEDAELASSCPSENAFTIQNSSEESVISFGYDGSLCLKGGMYEHADDSMLGN